MIELDEISLSGFVVRLIGCVEFDGAAGPYEPNGGDVPAIGFGLIRHLDRPLSLGYWGAGLLSCARFDGRDCGEPVGDFFFGVAGG